MRTRILNLMRLLLLPFLKQSVIPSHLISPTEQNGKCLLIVTMETTHSHFRWVIEKPDTLSNFALEGLQVELLPQHLADSSTTATTTTTNNMPCANGSSPQFSSGKRALRLNQNPKFIDRNGLQTVALENGCWELVWREGDICGNLICGFDVPYEVSDYYYGYSCTL